MRFSTLKKRFPSAHIEKAISTHSSNIAYVEKSGKWAHSEKGLTTVPNTLEEYGSRPTDSNGSNALLCELYELIKDGKSNFEILESNADLIKYFDKFDRIRLTLNTEKYKKCWRDLEVTYIWGKTGAGKSRHVMETYGYENVFRVTDYTHACQKLNIAIQEDVIRGPHSFRRNAITSVVNSPNGNMELASSLFGNSPKVAKSNYFTGIDMNNAIEVLNYRTLIATGNH